MSISPNVPSYQESSQYESTGTPRWIAVLFGVVIAALVVIGVAGYSTQSRMSQDLAEQQKQNKVLSAELEQANARIADLKSKMEITTQRVGLTQSELAQAKSRAEAIRKEQQAKERRRTLAGAAGLLVIVVGLGVAVVLGTRGHHAAASGPEVLPAAVTSAQGSC